MKTCYTCKKSKDEKEFSKKRDHVDGLQSNCKPCNKVRAATVYASLSPERKERRAETARRWVRKNSKKVSANQKRWASENSVRLTAYLKNWYIKNRVHVYSTQLKYRYGISPEDFKLLVAKQGGACAICREVKKRLCIDHDHKTGKVRSLLCYGCNSGIGLFKDSSVVAQLAADYLKLHKK